jgi:hypothetical protein
VKFFQGLLKALRAGLEGAAVVVLGQLAGFFQGPAPSGVSATIWLGISFIAVLGINFALGKLKAAATA